MQRTIEIDVPGVPAPQGSKRYVGNGRMVESSKSLPTWRHDVQEAAKNAVGGVVPPFFDGPVIVHVYFVFARPRSHYGTGRNASVLKASAPEHGPVTRNRADVDKLARAVLDAITHVVFADDSQVIRLLAAKSWADPTIAPGAYIQVVAV